MKETEKKLGADAVMPTRDEVMKTLKKELPGRCRYLRYLGRQRIAVRRVNPAQIQLAKRVLANGFRLRILKNEKK